MHSHSQVFSEEERNKFNGLDLSRIEVLTIEKVFGFVSAVSNNFTFTSAILVVPGLFQIFTNVTVWNYLLFTLAHASRDTNTYSICILEVVLVEVRKH